MRGHCDKEKQLAQQAKQKLQQLLPPRTKIILKDIKRDKYSGRHVATVLTKESANIGKILLESGLAAPYTGKGQKRDWCK